MLELAALPQYIKYEMWSLLVITLITHRIIELILSKSV